MTKLNSQDKNSFLYPRSYYYGQLKPENLVFNANLQEFAQKISYITSLETSGKLSPERAFRQIETLWKQLEDSKNNLEIGSDLSV
ncbi:hypothetical protein FD724_08680 [Nostoc sp. C057]|uniref:DUF7219 family protein n=1 Tax=Nostoc sp. C057 TaxID=2576903 RepID=UPI0015C2F23D|nr:hypothetical protein [Nostoc sp. C057]QLE48190.1 hypothetical protein FD724_08680 [Nostoc sp. C057]